MEVLQPPLEQLRLDSLLALAEIILLLRMELIQLLSNVRSFSFLPMEPRQLLLMVGMVGME